MADSQQSLYPFILSLDDGDACSIPLISNAEPIAHDDDSDSNLMNQVELKVKIIAAHEAEKANLHEDTVYSRLPPIDILIFGRSGVGKSCLLKAIANRDDIRTSAQLDHVTQRLQSFTKKIGKLTFRFWDTKGIDTWSTSNDVMNLLGEIEESQIRPLFVIYCASGNGRVNSQIVTTILNRLKETKTPIAYVITNMFNHSNEQLKGQIDGGLAIMGDVYLGRPTQKNKYHYEFDVLTDKDGNIIRDGKGILIGVNSQPYINDLTNTNKSKQNIFELMSFIASNLDDNDFTKFVALTLQNRDFWEKIKDHIWTQLYRCRDKLALYGVKLRDFVGNTFNNPFRSATEQ